jgi:hypothetical protein
MWKGIIWVLNQQQHSFGVLLLLRKNVPVTFDLVEWMDDDDDAMVLLVEDGYGDRSERKRELISRFHQIEHWFERFYVLKTTTAVSGGASAVLDCTSVVRAMCIVTQCSNSPCLRFRDPMFGAQKLATSKRNTEATKSKPRTDQSNNNSNSTVPLLIANERTSYMYSI